MPSLKAAELSISDSFYDPKLVQTINLEIKPEDLERMQQALPERITVPGVFSWNAAVIPNVGIRYKGNSSSSPNQTHKRSFLITFNEYENDRRFLGLRHAALDNGIQFGSLFSEPLITGILRELKVKASRCNHARLYLNKVYIGVYVNVERIDRSFLESNFDDDEGFLFKVDEGGPGADLRFLGADAGLYQQAFELKTGKKSAASAALVDFIRLINDPASTETRLRDAFEVESFLTLTAVMLFSGAFDQYTGWNPHNYFLYHNSVDQRWTYIPWDLDVGFADNAFGRVPVLSGWNAAWPAPVPGRPLMERILANTNLLQLYRQKAVVILETHFRPEILIPKLQAIYDQIRPHLEKDPFPAQRATVPSDSSYADIVASIKRFIRDRYAFARAQLAGPGQRPPFQPIEASPKDEGPQPGPDSPDAPSELRVTRVTSSRVELRWIDNARGEVAFVVQKCLEAGCTNFVNAIGQPGSDLTTATDNQVEPGQTYRYRVYAVLPTPSGPRGTGPSNAITVPVPAK